MPTAKTVSRKVPVAKGAQSAALDLLGFIDASPSPWHAVESAVLRLKAAGFSALDESSAWKLTTGGRYLVVRGGSSLIAFIVGHRPMEHTGLRLIGAHTDSPGLRLKPRAAFGDDSGNASGAGLLRLGVEVYGGPILATFSDRDLGLAGRVMVRSAGNGKKGCGVTARLLRTRTPVARLPNLAIHMNRDVNEGGLKFNKQTELPLLLGSLLEQGSAGRQFSDFLARELDVDAADILTWDLAAFDVQPGTLWGANQEFIASRQLDNLASCHAGLVAITSVNEPPATCVLGLFDHEEVGSTSATGAGGSFLADVLTRLSRSGEGKKTQATDRREQMLARSFFVSADMAHAWHPNFPNAYEPSHRVHVNGGPVVKSNVNQRYSTGADTAARFMQICERAKVPYQQYAHRTDLGCGSTIGPILAAQLGVPSVDVGSPMWAMHSARESAGALDQRYMVSALQELFANEAV
jgi:aspartyl aminopeptidase